MAKEENYEEIAKQIVDTIGEDNILSYTHCATRLRFEVEDHKSIDNKKIEELNLVNGVFYNMGQYQIVFDQNTVTNVYNAVKTVRSGDDEVKERKGKDDTNKLQKIIRYLSDIFVPIIPILGATGLFLGLRSVIFHEAFLALFDLTPAIIPEWIDVTTNVLTDTAFSFLAAFITWSAFKKVGGTPVVGFLVGLMLVSPILPNAYAVANGSVEPIMAFGSIPLMGNQGSILNALFTGILGANLEIKLRKIMPKSMDLIFTPFVVVIISVIFALFLLGPIITVIEGQLVNLIVFFLQLPFGLGGLLIGFIYPLAVLTGTHHMSILVETSLLASTGFNPLITLSAMYGFSNAAVCLAIALKSSDSGFKTNGISSTVTQILGVSEPALFGVVIRSGLKSLGIMVGCSAIGGMVLALLGIQANSYGLAVALSPLMYIYDSYQLLAYVLVGIGTFALAFVLTWMFIPKNSELNQTT